MTVTEDQRTESVVGGLTSASPVSTRDAVNEMIEAARPSGGGLFGDLQDGPVRAGATRQIDLLATAPVQWLNSQQNRIFAPLSRPRKTPF